MTYHVQGTVTYFPESGSYVKGWHESMPSSPALLASVRTTRTDDNIKFSTTLHDPGMRQLVASLKANKSRVYNGQLSAADVEIGRDNIDHLTLIRLYNQIMGQQEKWFYLDSMFNSINVDKLLLRMPFRDNAAAAQEVPKREEYNVSEVKYDEIQFDLPKIVVSHDMAIEDPMRALISPLIPLQQVDDYSMAYRREQEAVAALNQIGNYYKKSASGTAKFTSTSKATATADKISNPLSMDAGGVHSANRVADELQEMINDFMEQYDVILTHCACSPTTATKLAANTWTKPNTLFNVEAYRTSGGMRQFPGLEGKTMVISQLVPNDTLYFAAKAQNVLVKAEGPKITKSWEDNRRFVTQTATADFHQYKCAHEDLTIKRKFALIATLDTA